MFDSMIVLKNSMQKRLITALDKNKKLNLIYRGSRDGYNFDKTH